MSKPFRISLITAARFSSGLGVRFDAAPGIVGVTHVSGPRTPDKLCPQAFLSRQTTMSHSRRAFLTSTLAASAAAAVSDTGLRAAAPAGREYYDLRAYRLQRGATTAALDAYLEKALLPALDRRGIRSVGVFTELEVNKSDQTGVAKPDTPVWVLIPHATLDSFPAGDVDAAGNVHVVWQDLYTQGKGRTATRARCSHLSTRTSRSQKAPTKDRATHPRTSIS